MLESEAVSKEGEGKGVEVPVRELLETLYEEHSAVVTSALLREQAPPPYIRPAATGLEGGSASKSTCCSCRGPGFSSQLLLGGTTHNSSSTDALSYSAPTATKHTLSALSMFRQNTHLQNKINQPFIKHTVILGS